MDAERVSFLISFLIGVLGLGIFILFFFLKMDDNSIWQSLAVYLGIDINSFAIIVYYMTLFFSLVIFIPTFIYVIATKSYKSALELFPLIFMLLGFTMFCLIQYWIDSYVNSLNFPLAIKENISGLLYIYSLVSTLIVLIILGNEISCYFYYSKHYRKYSKKFKEYRKERNAVLLWFALWGVSIFVYISTFYFPNFSTLMLSLPVWVHDWIALLIYLIPPTFTYMIAKSEEIKDYVIIIFSIPSTSIIYVLDKALKTRCLSISYFTILFIIYILLKRRGHEGKSALIFIFASILWYIYFLVAG